MGDAESQSKNGFRWKIFIQTDFKIAKLQVPHSADNVACSPGGLAFLLTLP